MARRRQFVQLIYDLRAELGRSSDPNAGVSDLPSLKQTLGRVYETLYDEHDWPHLSVFSARTTLNAGQRYYDIPTGLSAETIEEIVVWWSGQPVPLDRGISFEQYAAYDPEADDRVDPAQAWDVRFTGTREQLEFWPLPASAQQFMVKGKRAFTPLVDDADLCLLDSHLVVLYAAVELLRRTKSPDADVKLAAAQQRMATLKGRLQGGQKGVKIGLGQGSHSAQSLRSIVRVGR